MTCPAFGRSPCSGAARPRNCTAAARRCAPSLLLPAMLHPPIDALLLSEVKIKRGLTRPALGGSHCSGAARPRNGTAAARRCAPSLCSPRCWHKVCCVLPLHQADTKSRRKGHQCWGTILMIKRRKKGAHFLCSHSFFRNRPRRPAQTCSRLLTPPRSSPGPIFAGGQRAVVPSRRELRGEVTANSGI